MYACMCARVCVCVHAFLLLFFVNTHVHTCVCTLMCACASVLASVHLRLIDQTENQLAYFIKDGVASHVKYIDLHLFVPHRHSGIQNTQVTKGWEGRGLGEVVSACASVCIYTRVCACMTIRVCLCECVFTYMCVCVCV